MEEYVRFGAQYLALVNFDEARCFSCMYYSILDVLQHCQNQTKPLNFNFHHINCLGLLDKRASFTELINSKYTE